jgi:hypothetical protein
MRFINTIKCLESEELLSINNNKKIKMKTKEYAENPEESKQNKNNFTMKKTIFFTLCLSALITLSASAKIWRVNNNPGVNADFTTIQAANDDVNVIAGDTLHIEPSNISYGDLNITKSLIILGNGYFLNENINNQANINMSIIGIIKFKTGSSNSQLIGLNIDSVIFGKNQIINNIVIERDKFTSSHVVGGLGNGAIHFDNLEDDFSGGHSISNITIRKNYINGGIYQPCDYDNCGVNKRFALANILILNNYVSEMIYLQGDAPGSTDSGLIITNNIIEGGILAACGATIQNNILPTTVYSSITLGGINSISNNNISGSPISIFWGIGSNNLASVDVSTLFVGLSNNTTDSQWHLKPASPGIGFGSGGVDCGIFGGVNPYQVSGLPAIPSVYLLNAPASNNTTTLPVTISVKSNN